MRTLLIASVASFLLVTTLAAAQDAGAPLSPAEKAAKVKAFCDDTRAARHAAVKPYVQAEVEFQKRVYPHAPAIQTRCAVPATPTKVIVQTERGKEIRDVRVSCKGGNPGGVSDDDVLLILARASGGADFTIESEVPTTNEANARCLDLDAAIGFNNAPKISEPKALAAFLAWKPSPKEASK